MRCKLHDIANEIAHEVSTLRPARGNRQELGVLSRRLVQLMRHRAGRGPTEAKSFLAGDDAVLVLFVGGFTKAERTLLDHGRTHMALAYRHAVQEALEREMCAEVEQVMGRAVVAAMGCAHQEPDVVAQVFLLEPLGGSGDPVEEVWGAGGSPAPHDASSSNSDGAA
jgi:uncharacterized protein YbcI